MRGAFQSVLPSLYANRPARSYDGLSAPVRTGVKTSWRATARANPRRPTLVVDVSGHRTVSAGGRSGTATSQTSLGTQRGRELSAWLSFAATGVQLFSRLAEAPASAWYITTSMASPDATVLRGAPMSPPFAELKSCFSC